MQHNENVIAVWFIYYSLLISFKWPIDACPLDWNVQDIICNDDDLSGFIIQIYGRFASIKLVNVCNANNKKKTFERSTCSMCNYTLIDSIITTLFINSSLQSPTSIRTSAIKIKKRVKFHKRRNCNNLALFHSIFCVRCLKRPV